MLDFTQLVGGRPGALPRASRLPADHKHHKSAASRPFGHVSRERSIASLTLGLVPGSSTRLFQSLARLMVEKAECANEEPHDPMQARHTVKEAKNSQ